MGSLGAGHSHTALIGLCERTFGTSAAHDVSIAEPDIRSILTSTSALAAASTPIVVLSPLSRPVDNFRLAVGVVSIREKVIAIILNLQVYLVDVLLAIRTGILAKHELN